MSSPRPPVAVIDGATSPPPKSRSSSASPDADGEQEVDDEEDDGEGEDEIDPDGDIVILEPRQADTRPRPSSTALREEYSNGIIVCGSCGLSVNIRDSKSGTFTVEIWEAHQAQWFVDF